MDGNGRLSDELVISIKMLIQTCWPKITQHFLSLQLCGPGIQEWFSQEVWLGGSYEVCSEDVTGLPSAGLSEGLTEPQGLACKVSH